MRPIHSLAAFLNKRSRWFNLALALLFLLLLGVLDFWTGPELAFSIFYLVPIVLAVWFGGGKSPGVALSLVSALVWLWADVASGQTYSHTLIPFWNCSVRLGFFLIFTVLLDRQKRLLAEEKLLARTDPLTGILNRRAFAELAAREINRSSHHQQPFTFIYLDIDDFKTINGRSGHSGGDLLLQRLAQTVGENLRLSDLLVRLGGDEFGILLPETPYPSAQTVICKMRTSLDELDAAAGVAGDIQFGGGHLR